MFTGLCADDFKARADVYLRGMSFVDAQNKLVGLLGGNREIFLVNGKNGEVVRLSKTSVGKLMSNAAVKKSIDNGFTREQHYAVVSDIDELFKRSVKILKRQDSIGEVGIFIHRFAAPLYFRNAVVYITVKESRQHNSKRIYTAELIEIKKLEGMLEEARENSHTLHPASSFYDSNINDLISNVNT